MPNLSNLAFQASSKLSSMIGNPGQMMEQQLYRNAIDENQFPQYRISLTSINNTYTVIGLLTNNVSFSIDADWQAAGLLESITSNPLLSTLYQYGTMVMGAAGYANPSNIGISTKKIYTGSGYLKLDVQFRVVDWQGKGDPIKQAFLVAGMCLPDTKGGTTNNLNQLFTTLNQGLGFAAGLITDTLTAATDVTNFAANLSGNATAQKASETAKKAIQPIQQDINTYLGKNNLLIAAFSPSPVRVEIGKYFKHNDMIVESAKIEFSRQITEAGPLYVDFDIGLSSQQTMLLNDDTSTQPQLGLVVSQKSRVTNR